ncbi:hypothetical protein DFJ73DRAFT_947703 [Zopfochytrium polystomum]|nr:hypothetical protein DFJ73DRAFT_947703 [Zopfochytrium polystomum]
MDVRVFLSKGSGFRFKYRNCDEYWKNEECIGGFAAKILEPDIVKRERMVNFARNRVWGLGVLKQSLINVGLLLRKADRGCEWCIVDINWELRQLEVVQSVVCEPDPEFGGRVYFLPKVHKPGVVKGRPIVCWRKGTQGYANSVNKVLWEEIDRIGICKRDWKEVAGFAMEKSAGWVTLAGDVKSMFTKVPRKTLVRLLWSDEKLKHCRKVILKHISRANFVDMIDMGSKLSPPLAMWYLSKQLEGKVKVQDAEYMKKLIVSSLEMEIEWSQRVASMDLEATHRFRPAVRRWLEVDVEFQEMFRPWFVSGTGVEWTKPARKRVGKSNRASVIDVDRTSKEAFRVAERPLKVKDKSKGLVVLNMEWYPRMDSRLGRRIVLALLKHLRREHQGKDVQVRWRQSTVTSALRKCMVKPDWDQTYGKSGKATDEDRWCGPKRE